MDEIYKEQTILTNCIHPKNSLQRNQKQLKLIKELSYRLNKFENKMLLSKDIETLRYICSLIEDSVNKRDKIDKKSLVIDVYKDVFGETNIDTDFIERGIEFLLDNKKIKKLSILKKYIYPFANFFLRRLL